jgi:Family of unknown function (DUF6173)
MNFHDLPVNFPLPNIEPIHIPPNPNFALKDIAEANLASVFYEILVNRINAFDKELDNNFDVGVRLVNFGQTVIFHLEDMAYHNPSLIMFKGRTNEGEQVELIQHTSQISILLMKLPRPDPELPKQKIGFATTS